MYIRQLDDWGKPMYFVYLHGKDKFIGTLEEALEEVNVELEKVRTLAKQPVTLALALEQQKHQETIDLLEKVIEERNELDRNYQNALNTIVYLRQTSDGSLPSAVRQQASKQSKEASDRKKQGRLVL